MKNSEIKIKEYIFLNSWEIEYKVGKNHFVACIETEDLEEVFEDYDSEEYETPQDFLEADKDIEKLLAWFHTEYKDHIEPISRKESIIYQSKIEKAKEEKQYELPLERVEKDSVKVAPFKTTFEKQNGMWTEVPNPAYIKALEGRLDFLEKEMQAVKEEQEKRNDILLTATMIEHQYNISRDTINQARRHNRLAGVKINGKEYAYPKREIDRYIQTDVRLQKAAS